ncbi:VanZ family protein [Streptomyces fagopyri]|uniref:VanZ family protein n=1 Tax=Streptomyces fagopyri TaxID=2662397 RepID=UPI0037135D43
MFTAIFQHEAGYLAACTLIALALGCAAWTLARRIKSPRGVWWAGLVFSLTGVLGVTFMNSSRASGMCVFNRQLSEPFHTTQGLWNLAMMIPVGILALMAVRRPLPVLVGVVVLPLGIEFTQATVGGLGRVCDSSDAEMNIVGGLLGLCIAAAVLTLRQSLDWLAGLKGALIASAAFLLLGMGVARPMIDFTSLDGTGLSAADAEQKRAVEAVVKEAFGDRYKVGQLYEQPCEDLTCKNIIFNLHSRTEGHREEFGSGRLSWPDKQHLNVLLEDSDRPTIMGYPVKASKVPTTGQEANRLAESYAQQQYPWAKSADVQQTFPVGENAQLGWITNWRWTHSGVLMPRMLDVQVDGAGQVSQIDVTLGPTSLNLPRAKLNAKEAEEAVSKAVSDRMSTNGDTATKFRVKAFTVKAVDHEGKWAPNWLVNVTGEAQEHSDDAEISNPVETYRVNAINGQVFDSGGVSMEVH